VEVMTVSTVYAEIARGGYFDAAVRPGPYDAARIPPEQLEYFLRKHTVRMRGWPVPYVDDREPVHRHGHWIGQEHSSGRHKEAWRLTTSGQFLHRRAFVSDLVDAQEPAADANGATGSVVVWDVLLYAVELVELAARFATDLACHDVKVSLHLVNVEGRQLVSGDWARELYGPYIVHAARLDARREVLTAELLAEPREVAVRLTQELIGQFGVDIPDQALMDWQEKTFNRR
jgi:hypothetical protein